MSRVPMALLVLLAIGSIGVIGYSHLRGGEHVDDDTALTQPAAANVAPMDGTIASPNAASSSEQPMAPSQASPPAAPTATDVAKWIKDATGDDAKARAAAITALAHAPRADAIPVLRKVLTDGEPTVDRPLALESLRDLALSQGDSDDRIRSALRNTIYDGNDDATTQAATDVLAEIENGLTAALPGAP